MERNEKVIVMKNVSKVYSTGKNQYRALNGVNIEIEKGEFVAIVGPSGAGKSTLMNLIGCLDTLTEGEYYLDGISIGNMKDNQLADIRNRKIGFIFQTYNLISKLNVLENVELPLIYMGVPFNETRKRAISALKKLGLESHLKHKPTELSGGQMQRVAIARAIVTNPEIILADEPTGALDSKTGMEVLNILKELNKEGNTIVLITHDMNIASNAKRIVTVKDGVIVSDSCVEKLKEVGVCED
ncbi:MULTISPECIES: ABC transporter ATP-binding protein [Caloramator]|uniref:Putative ABC transport system ATP-binding protein n=1 Tax=Caloramator proteoclasticus DSM 10124 TaxID=1121262 RepID=A0A1M4Y3N3_9CLOT|nr:MULTISPECIES: ABC transporter ATP-binding protein [Caloramator]SHF00424.1 putative ABC transport system ATP-binding protein [Caloramator proteoclasticus DSM 10124]